MRTNNIKYNKHTNKTCKTRNKQTLRMQTHRIAHTKKNKNSKDTHNKTVRLTTIQATRQTNTVKMQANIITHLRQTIIITRLQSKNNNTNNNTTNPKKR